MGRASSAVRDWIGRGDAAIALATVVRVYQAAPRPAGSVMAMSVRGEIEGSVSGGCIEGEVAHEAAEVLASGVPRLIQTGITDAQAWDAGLTCGGAIDIWVERLDAPAARWLADAWDGPGGAVAVAVVDGTGGDATGVRAIVRNGTVTVAPGAVEGISPPVVAAARALVAEGHHPPA